MNDKEAFDKLPLLAEQYNFMTESQRLLVGWRPHANGGSELDGADGKTKVTAQDIKNFDKMKRKISRLVVTKILSDLRTIFC